MYMSNFSVVIFQLEPFKYLGSIEAPYDLQLKGGQERSGLAAIAVNTQGQLSVCTRLGTLLLYDLPQFDQPAKTVSLDYKKVNQQVENRAASNLQIQIMRYHPVHVNVLFAYEQFSKEIMALNTQNCRIFSISTPDYINALQIVDDYLLIGSALEGSYQILDCLNDFLAPIFTKDQPPKNKVGFKYIFQERSLGYSVPKDTIFTTSPLQWNNINYETCYCIEQNPTAQTEVGSQVLSCWYSGSLRLHGLQSTVNNKEVGSKESSLSSKIPVSLLGERRLQDVICACFVAGSHGNVVLGTKSGKIIFCSLGALLRQRKISVGDKKLDNELEAFLESDTLNDAEINRQVIISRFGQIITINSCQLSIKGALKVFIYGLVSSGGFYVYECTTNTIIADGAACGHTESIFQLQFHPTIPNVFATAASDATVKIWRKTAEGIQLDQQFGQTGYTSQSRLGQCKFVFKNNNSAKSGGQIDSQALTGAILSAAWDPRESSCLMILGGWRGSLSICDVWRSTVYASLPSHEGKVHDAKWAMIPGLSKSLSLICTVGSDGVGRIYGVDYPLRIQGVGSTSHSENVSADPKHGPESTVIATVGLGLQLQNLEKNYVEFAHNSEIPIIGCAFSPHEPLLATTCRDGYVRVYDLRPFDPDDTIAIKSMKQLSQNPSLRRPIQIGKFSVSQKSLFHITFHPKMKNVLALTSDSSEVRVYRYEFDGGAQFKVQCASILVGHKSASRPLHFSPEVPQILFSGSWDGSVIAWNWVHNIQLGKFNMGSDVYGLGGPLDSSGLEIYASSRDLTIRRLFLNFTAQQLTSRLVFLPLATYASGSLPGMNVGVQGSIESVRRGLRGVHNIQLTKELRNAIASIVQTPSYRKMRDEPPEMFILSGKSAENLLVDLSDDSPALQIIAEIAKITFPSNGGATELLRTVLYFQQHHDIDLYVDDIMDDRVAYEEHENACNGLVLSARALQHMAAATGLHYMRSLFGVFEGRVPEEFKQKKYGFYQFQRRLPNVKADAYKYQFQVGIMLLAASGMYKETAQILKLIDSPERVFYENLYFDEENDVENKLTMGKSMNGAALAGELWARNKYPRCLTQRERQVLVAVGIYQSTGTSNAIKDLLPVLCKEGLHCVAKMLAYQIRSEKLISWVSREAARAFIARGQPVRAALELCSSNQVDLAARMLSLAGEPLLAALLSLASPEEGFPLGLIGAAEICFKHGMQPSTLVALARGSNQSAPKASPYTGFLSLQHIQTQFRQLCAYGETFQESFLTESQIIESPNQVLTDLINAGNLNMKTENNEGQTEKIPQHNTTVSRLLSMPPDRFYDQILNFMEPATIQALMGFLGGETVEEQFGKANTCLLAIVNKYIKMKNLKSSLFTLYNLFRYKSMGLNDIVYEGAFYSNYLAGKYAAETLKLDQIAAFLFSQAEKIQTKFNVCSDVTGVKLLKLKAVYRYSGRNDVVKAKILQVDPKWQESAEQDVENGVKYAENSFVDNDDEESDTDGDATQIQHDMDVFLSGVIGAQKLRSLVSPFNIKLQADLNFCPSTDE